jgi:hypothetical protein
MRISILFEQNLGLSSLATTKTVSGANATALLLFFLATLFGFWFQWRSRSITPSAKAIAKTYFAKAFCPRKRLPSFDLSQVIPRLSQMNICFFSRLFMAFVAALDIGTRKSTKFSFPLVLPLLSRIHASSSVLFKIPTIPTVMFPITSSLLVFMLMALFTSRRIPRSRTYFAAFSASIAKLISWGSSSGFLVFTSLGKSLLPWFWFT